ncbi:MAG: hypothetical protein WED86_01530 [Chloroflexota bacterium]
MQSPSFRGAATPDTHLDDEHQLDLVRGAIALLATGGARRVALVNISLGEETLREARAIARGSGMILRVAPNGVASDITVEASG